MAQNLKKKGRGLKATMGGLGKGGITPEMIAAMMKLRQGGAMNPGAGPMPQGMPMPPMGRR